jgi:hypothetical protein
MLRRFPPATFKEPKSASLDWNNFRGGWNSFLRQTELSNNELSDATNLMLIGLGVPTKRWGTEDYFTAGATGYGRGLIFGKDSSDNRVLLAITDWGYLTKKSGTTYTMITGASWASGYNLEGIQIANKIYLVNGQRELVRYDFTSLVGFPTLAVPTGVTATNISGATGQTTVAYQITANSQVGETLPSTEISLASMPQDLTTTLVRLQWTPVSAASGVLTGYSIYRGSPGDETLLATVDNVTTQYLDIGLQASILTQPPADDTTGGPVGKFIARYQDRIIIGGIPGSPTLIYISGRYPYHERFSFAFGGGTLLVSPDDGQNITGISVINDKIIIFKEHSVYQVTLGTIDVGTTTILVPTYTLITAGQGCYSHRSVIAVDNDIYFVGQDGIYVLGYEPNILNVLRTNELSAKIRPFFASLSLSDLQNCSAEYYDRKYVLTFPSAQKTIIFDKERLAFMGPWNTPFGISKLLKYTDSDGVSRLVGIDSTDSKVTHFDANLRDDKGTAFTTVFKSRKEQFGAWDAFKTIDEMFMQFRNVSGTVNVNVILENRAGAFSTEKSFTVTGSSQLGQTGWGTDLWGSVRWGETINDPGVSAEEMSIRVILEKEFRTMQLEILTSDKQDNYELLGVRSTVHSQGPGVVPYTWNV